MTSKKLAMYLLALLPLSFSACMPDLSPAYGIVKVKVGEQEVYFKREARGLSYDALVISTSDSFCGMPDPQSDYIFREQGPLRLYYKVDNNSLIIYARSRAIQPEVKKFLVNIVQKELTVLEFDRLEKDATRLGLFLLEISMKESKQCK